jgi:hypothetical protein
VNNKKPEDAWFSGHITGHCKQRSVNSFFHPDYTVDPGISPGPAQFALVGYTTDRELELALLTLPRRLSI